MADLDAALVALIRARADGCCEYCGISGRTTLMEHQIDHVIAVKHGGETAAGNLALCCAICNRYKGSDIASIDGETGKLTALYHPRRNNWADHFELLDGEISGTSATGRATVALLRMNRPDRIRERRHWLIDP